MYYSTSFASRIVNNDQFSLHLNMAQECMAIFEKAKLPAVASVEQVRIL